MKRTTYIFIGFFFANVIFAVILLVYLKTTMTSSGEMKYAFTFAQQQNSSLDLEDVHTFEFITKGVEADQFYFASPGKIKITASTVPGQRMISYPSSDYLKVSKADGVLSVVVDLTSENLKEDHSGIGRGIFLKGLVIHIETDELLKSISGNRGFEVTMQDFHLDSLHLAAKSLLRVKGCEIQSLVLDPGVIFKAEASSFNDLHVDLDEMHWDIKESKVNTLYLTGSKRHENYFFEDQYCRLVWKPKTEKAELNLTLRGEAEVVAVH